MKGKKWLISAAILVIVFPVCALGAPFVMKALFWRFGSDPAVAVLRGEHWGLIVRMGLLTAAPFVPVVCFILERIGVRRAKRQWESAQPPEFATQEERRDFYRKELSGQRKAPGGTPWIAYAALCGAAVFLFGTEVLRAALPQEIGELGRDLELYQSGQAEVYQGPLLLVERQLRRGARELPDERFVYYDTAGGGSLRCAATLLSYTQLNQLSYTVTYLPETGTILTITDREGNERTSGMEVDLTPPEGCWMYGDLAVPVCDGVEGYEALTKEQRALFDLMYAQVLSGDVAAGRQNVRSFALPYPLKKDEYNQVVELYESSIEPGQYPDHCYWTDDGRIVRRASCNRIIHTR